MRDCITENCEAQPALLAGALEGQGCSWHPCTCDEYPAVSRWRSAAVSCWRFLTDGGLLQCLKAMHGSERHNDVEQEATEAIKPILGKYYAKDTRNVWKAVWEDWDSCHYVAPDAPGSGVFWYHR